MSVESRLKRIEKQLCIDRDVARTILVVLPPKQETDAKAEVQARQAELDRRIQEGIRRDPKRSFFFVLG